MRFYDPVTRRFTQEDPLKDGANWYAYVYDNPLRYVDPSGLYYIRYERDAVTGDKVYYAEPQTTFDTVIRTTAKDIFVPDLSDIAKDFTVDSTVKSLEKQFPAAANIFKSVAKVLDPLFIAKDVADSYWNVQRYDSIIFKLFEIAEFTPSTVNSRYTLERYMEKAYNFVNSYPQYFSRILLCAGQPLFWVDVKIRESNNPAEKIESYSDAYSDSFFNVNM
jgi:hypothetical protein